MRPRLVDEVGIVHLDSLWSARDVEAIAVCEYLMLDSETMFASLKPSNDVPTCLWCVGGEGETYEEESV